LGELGQAVDVIEVEIGSDEEVDLACCSLSRRQVGEGQRVAGWTSR